MRQPVLRRAFIFSPIVILCLVYAGLVGLRVLYPMRFDGAIHVWSQERTLDPALVASVIRAESRFRPAAVSPRGAIGLMQIMPETGIWLAAQIGIETFSADDLLDPDVNIRFGTWYLKYLVDRLGSLETALQAYNAGPTNAERWRSDNNAPFPETAVYVDRVLAAVPVYRFLLRAPIVLRITPSLPI